MSKPGPKMILIIIFAMFLAPVLLAVYFNSGWSEFRPAVINSSGQILEPALKLSGRLENYRGVQVDSEVFSNRWWMIVYAPNGCDSDCQGRLAVIRQIHRSLGKDQPGVGIAVISGVSLAVNQVEQVHAVFEEIIQLFDRDGEYERQFSALASAESDAVNQLFLLDPMAHVILFYPAMVEPAGIRQDLTRLLRLSPQEAP